MRVETIDIDLYQEAYSVVPLKQNDDTTLNINVYENSAPFTAERVIFNAVLPSGKPIVQKEGITIAGNVIIVVLDESIVSEAGEVQFEARFYEGEKSISTYIFNAYVDPEPLPGKLPPFDEINRIITSSQITHIWIGTQSDYNSMQHNNQTLYFIEG